MASIPRPLLALLLVVMAVFAAWMTLLKPSSSSQTNAPAPAVVVHSGGSSAHTQAKPKAAAATAKAPSSAPAKPAKLAAAQRRVNAVDAALRKGQVVALLFYNPAGADDQADRAEIAAIPTHHGKIFRLAVPVQEVTRYSVITNQVPVTGTPTLVVIDSHHRATDLVGFADPLEIDHLVAGALAAK